MIAVFVYYFLKFVVFWGHFRIIKIILNLLENDFQEKDICILTRKKADGIVLGSFLQEKGITVVSSETLLLQH